jgi:hypothetical protein
MPETQAVQREATSIKVKPDVWKEFKVAAIREDKTVSQLLEDMIEAWLKEHKRK